MNVRAAPSNSPARANATFRPWCLIFAPIIVLALLFAPVDIAVIGVAIIAGGVCWALRAGDIDPGPPEKRFVFAAFLYLLVGLGIALLRWRVPLVPAGFAALLLAYPVYRALRLLGFDERALRLSTAVAACAATVVGCTALAVTGPAAALASPSWAEAAFAIGAVSMGLAGSEIKRPANPAAFFAGVLGMTAGLIFGGWGVWLALPVVAVVWFLHSARDIPTRKRWAGLLILFMVIDLALASYGTGVLARFRWLVLQTSVLFHSGGDAGFFGAVLGDWRAGLAAFVAHPALGTSLAGKLYLNQYIQTLSGSGLAGAATLVSLIGAPAVAFARMAEQRDPAVIRIGRAGLLLVTAYAVMGLLQPVFAVDRTLVLYVFAVVALLVAARGVSREALNNSILEFSEHEK